MDHGHDGSKIGSLIVGKVEAKDSNPADDHAPHDFFVH
jgi:hypothetical protein